MDDLPKIEFSVGGLTIEGLDAWFAADILSPTFTANIHILLSLAQAAKGSSCAPAITYYTVKCLLRHA